MRPNHVPGIISYKDHDFSVPPNLSKDKQYEDVKRQIQQLPLAPEEYEEIIRLVCLKLQF